MRVSMDVFKDKESAMRAWAHSTATGMFVEWLDVEREVVITKLRDAHEVSEVFRLQGELSRIDKVVELTNALQAPSPKDLQRSK
jgi:hypothetical protein